MKRLRVVALAIGLITFLPASPAGTRTNLGVTVGDGEERLAVVQQDLHRVDLLRIRGATAKVVQRLGRRGTEPGELLLPEGAFIAADRTVWVSDSGNHRLQRFDRTGKSRQVVGDLGRFGHFSQPSGIAPGPDGRIYVADTGQDRIVVLDRRGRAVAAWGESGAAPGQLSRPHGVAVSRDGTRVYVIDLVLPRIQVFTSEGRFIEGTPEGDRAIVNATAIATATTTAGDEAVYLTDETLGRVTKFSRDLRPLTAWGGPHGSAPGSFYNPQGVAVDRTERVWVVDYGNHRGETFTSSGRFLFAFEEGQIGVRKSTRARWSPRWVVLIPAVIVWCGVVLARRGSGRTVREAV